MDKQIDRQMDSPIPRCPWQIFQARGIKTVLTKLSMSLSYVLYIFELT